jgi:hypothetical protein
MRGIIGAATLAVLGAALVGCGASTGVAASCVAPQVEVSPASARPGDTIEVRGVAFVTSCSDTVENGVRAPSRPLDREITVSVRQGSASLVLGKVHASTDEGRFVLRAVLPRLPAGRAQVTTDVPLAVVPMVTVR